MQNGQIFFHKMIQNQNGLKIFEHTKIQFSITTY